MTPDGSQQFRSRKAIAVSIGLFLPANTARLFHLMLSLKQISDLIADIL